MQTPIATIVRDCLGYLETCRVTDAPYGSYRYGPGCPPTAWASAFACHLRHLCGDLDGLSAEERASWIRVLQDAQDERTGLWIDPVFRVADKLSPTHPVALLHWHSSTFIASALRLLGGGALFPIAAVHEFRDPRAMECWLMGLPWLVSPWQVGNWTYDMACLMGEDLLVTGDARNRVAMDAFFAWHDRHQRDDSGWWDLSGTASVMHQQYGGYHSLMAYWMWDRPVPRPELMIRSSLSFQWMDQGHFGGGCCSDMDVVDAVVSLSRQYGICQAEVATAMCTHLPWQLAQRCADGGFRDQGAGAGDGRSEFGWTACSVATRQESDPCSTWFRLYSVALIGEVLPESGIAAFPWRHHGGFGHGVRPRALLTTPSGR